MTEQEKLQKAYFVLGLEPGAPLDKITRRHKRLIMVWHPDRFPTADGKKDAEEELKQINNAKDDLKNHFEKNHKASGPCDCKPSPGASSPNTEQGARTGGPGPGKRKTTQETNREEEEAQRRSREREARAAQEAAEKERKKQEESRPTPPEQTAAQAAEQAKLLADERLRWKVSLCIGAAWLGLSLFGWAGTSLKSWWHDFSWKWERDHAPQQQPAPQPQTNNNYVPPYQVSPYNNNNANPSTSPFGPVGPPPTEQNNSPYSTLDSLNKEGSSSTQAPPSTTTTTPPSLSSPLFQQSSPSLFQGNQNSLRQNASDFLNSGSSRPSQIAPLAPSSGVGNTFSQTVEDINKRSGQ